MYNIVKKYCDDSSFSNGLLLIDTPTGFGKTHDVIKYIFEASTDEKNIGRKYFFITTLKKNLPQEELRKRYVNKGIERQFDEKFLFIDSNADSAINGYSSDLFKNVSSELRKTDEFKDFKSTVEFLKEKHQGKMSLAVSKYFREDVEPKFRRIIQKELVKQFNTVDKRIEAIVMDPKWKWVERLYPSVLTRKKQIIFMSMDKFLAKNSTIVEPSYMLYNSKLLDNACIFIDEFDATKETILKNIINESLQERIDIIDLFRKIYSSLKTDVFPADLTTASKERIKGDYKDQSLQEIIDKTRSVAESIFNDYTLEFNHKTRKDIVDDNKNFIFQDYQYHSLVNGSKGFLTTETNTRAKVNEICLLKDCPEREDGNINKMLGRLRGFITYFQKAVKILAINYVQLKKDRRRDGEDEFTYESAIKSVLALFHLPERYSEYLTNQILISSHKSDNAVEGAEYDLSFYEKGFRYYAFEDDSIHDMQSTIMMYSFHKTPEKILLRFCEKAKVVGLSATGRIPTVIGNYDLKYIKSKLNTSFRDIAEEEIERLEKKYAHTTKGYSNVEIVVKAFELIDEKQYHSSWWQRIFDNNDFSNAISEKIEQYLREGDEYAKARYCRIAFAYKEFICHDDIKSFLCVLTKHPRPNDNKLDLNLLLSIFSLIAKERGVEFNKRTIVQLDGDEYDSKKDDILNRLGQGEKLFVISVYPTIGAGQNLQYQIPESLKEDLVKVNDYSDSGKKDFDAIYLDRPTNVLVNLGTEIEEDDFLRYLFQVEFLQEVCEISCAEAFGQIKNAFVCFSTRRPASYGNVNLYETKSVKNYATRTVIQAIGRICRTNIKNKNIYIFIDGKIIDGMINPSVVNEKLIIPEFKALMEKCNNTFIPNKLSEFENKAALLSVRVNKEIQNLLENDWTQEKMQKWSKLRELVLKHPTISEIERNEDSFKFNNFYVHLPEIADHYFYRQESDYSKIDVCFDHRENCQVVSSESSRLNLMMKLPGVREYFEKKGWKTRFEPGEYIMSPALFNNIYKGALGEYVGRLILWKYKINLDDITDENLFELFDFSVKNNPSVFVDFKNWKESTSFKEDDMVKKIIGKATKCKAKAIIVINTFSRKNEYKIKKMKFDGLTILTVPIVNEEAVYEIKRFIDEYSN